MVETMADRLRELMGEMTYEEFGELAGVSAQAVQKWMNGGNISDKNLDALLKHPPFKKRRATKEWVRYGAGATQRVEGAALGKYLFPRAYSNIVAGMGKGRFNEDYTIEVAGTIAVPAWLVSARGWKIVVLAGCATGNWSKPGSSEAEFNMARGECSAQAHSVSQPRLGQQDLVFKGCMEGKGWTFQ